jgi:NIPSNAP
MGKANPRRIRDSSSTRILELRQYTLHPGKRDELIALWEKYFMDPQEKMGADLVGQFRELGNPNLFVWLRAFPDMPTRGRMLQEFYNSPAWMEHRQQANDTMADSDNVLLLHEARHGSGFSRRARPPVNSELPKSLVTGNICYFDHEPAVDFLDFFEGDLEPAFARAGGPSLAAYTTERGPNNFPRLPVREGENVFVWFARFASEAAYDGYLRNLEASAEWPELRARIRRFTGRNAPALRLAPTLRSKLS